MSKKRLRLAVPAAVLAMGLTACGSGDSKAMDAWAVSLCSGVQGPVQQANTALADTGTVKNAEAPKDLQTRLAADFGTLATANTEIAQAVQKAGAPKVDNGAQTQADAVTELNQAAGGYTKVQQTVQQLPAGDQAKFADGLKGVSDQVQRLSGLSTSALQSLQTGALGVALAKQPGCKSVNGAASATAAPSGSGGASAPSSGSAAPTPGSSARPTATATATGKATGAAKPTATASAH